MVGDRVSAVNGEDADPKRPLRSVSKALSEAVAGEEIEPIALTVMRGEETLEIAVTPEQACAPGFAIGSTPTINATAGFTQITVHAGLARLADDAELQFVIAHELGHVLEKHVRKGMRASLLSGRAVLGVAAGIGGSVVDIALGLIGQQPEIPLGTRGAALVATPFSVDFEREADYVGAYLVARTGAPSDDLDTIFSDFARVKPISTWARLTHPSGPERIAAMKATAAEIAAKRAAGEPLLPEGFSLPQPKDD